MASQSGHNIWKLHQEGSNFMWVNEQGEVWNNQVFASMDEAAKAKLQPKAYEKFMERVKKPNAS